MSRTIIFKRYCIERLQKRGQNQTVVQNAAGVVSSSSAVYSVRVSSNNPFLPNLMQNDLNLTAVNDASLSIKQIFITNESARYALTRFRCAAYVLHLKTEKITINQVKKYLVGHCKKVHQTNI